MNQLTTHRNHEYWVIRTGIGVVCGLGCASSLIRAVEHVVTLALIALAVLTLAWGALRLVARRVREYREDCADERTAAAWRAQHRPTHHTRDPRAASAVSSGQRGVA